jgi:hypothetical protein
MFALLDGPIGAEPFCCDVAFLRDSDGPLGCTGPLSCIDKNMMNPMIAAMASKVNIILWILWLLGASGSEASGTR